MGGKKANEHLSLNMRICGSFGSKRQAKGMRLGMVSFKSRGGGGGVNKVLYGKAPPEAQPLTLLNTIFDRKGTYFVHLRILLKSGTPFRV